MFWGYVFKKEISGYKKMCMNKFFKEIVKLMKSKNNVYKKEDKSQIRGMKQVVH